MEYEKAKDLLSVQLIEPKFKSGREYLEGLKGECIDIQRQINRFSREIRITQEVIDDPRTVGRERQPLLDKIRNLIIGKELTE